MLSIINYKSDSYIIAMQFNSINDFQLESSNWKEDTRSSKSESWTSQSSNFSSLNVRKCNSITQGVGIQTLIPSLILRENAKMEELSRENKSLNAVAGGLDQNNKSWEGINFFSKRENYSFPKIFHIKKVNKEESRTFISEEQCAVQNYDQTQNQENLNEPPKFYIEKVVNVSKADRKADNIQDSDETSLMKVFKITKNAGLKRKSVDPSHNVSDESYRVRKYFKIERILRKRKTPLKQFKFSETHSAFQKFTPMEVSQMSSAEGMAKMSEMMTAQLTTVVGHKLPVQLQKSITCQGLRPELRMSLAYKLLKCHNLDPLDNSGLSEGCVSAAPVMHMPVARSKRM